MYGYRGTRRSVRESTSPYGGRTPQARFPADDVLVDLATIAAEDGDEGARLARILARYAALRAWLLRVEKSPLSLTRHADAAARLHLEATGGWAEGALLLELLEADLPRSAGLLALSGAEARSVGDLAGAEALRDAARLAALLRIRDQRRRS